MLEVARAEVQDGGWHGKSHKVIEGGKHTCTTVQISDTS